MPHNHPFPQHLIAHTQVHVLMNNAGISRPCPAFSLSTPLEDLQANWHAVLDTNFFGILNVAQTFAPYMARQENASVIINTGSKQGITCPPYVYRDRGVDALSGV
jgi:NAD(P)-dependent dehydrogenase (short-subunit alcohol dehydrogenase family)